MLVATGTSTVLPEATVQAMAGAFAALPDISFVWSLKEVRHKAGREGRRWRGTLAYMWFVAGAGAGPAPGVACFSSRDLGSSTSHAFKLSAELLPSKANTQHFACLSQTSCCARICCVFSLTAGEPQQPARWLLPVPCADPALGAADGCAGSSCSEGLPVSWRPHHHQRGPGDRHSRAVHAFGGRSAGGGPAYQGSWLRPAGVYRCM